ncbi:MAG: homoserine kinase [Gemmatimonadaceae bacterium]|nr:homoserine kinase [Gemmatimonadaceae bacterium]
MTTSDRTATVRVPASAANLGGGFDCVGVAVDRWLMASVRQDASGPAAPEFERAGTLASLNMRDSQDAIYIAFRAAAGAKRVTVPERLRFRVTSEIPVGRGLGSSAAAFVAGAALASEMLKLGLDKFGIAEVGTALEGHPDNVCPSVFGGATLALTHAGQVIVSPLEVHPSLAFVFAVPEFVLETKRAREALPNVVPHVTAVQAAAKGAALVRGLATADEAMLAAALDDVLHVPHRRRLVRGYDAVTAAAVAAGAIGATLSGAGSSILAIARAEKAEAVGAAMARAWQLTGVSAAAFASAERVKGYHVVA